MTPEERNALIILQKLEEQEKRIETLENEVQSLKKGKRHGTNGKDTGAEK